MTSSSRHIALPALPRHPAITPFPLLTFFAPLVAAGALWAFTRSPFVVVFAVLGPVIALATMGDAGRRARAEERAELDRFEHEVEAVRQAIDDAHEAERLELVRKFPPAATVAAASVHDPERWRTHSEGEVVVRLGTGRGESGLTVQDPPTTDHSGNPRYRSRRHSDERHARALDDLRLRAQFLENASIVADAKLGIGVCGARVEGKALLSSLAAQVANALSPAAATLELSPGARVAFPWARNLPHLESANSPAGATTAEVSPSTRDDLIAFRFRVGQNVVVLAFAESPQSLPRDCRIVVELSGSRAQLVRHPESRFREAFVADFLSDREAVRCAETLREASRDVVADAWDHLPERVRLRELTGNDGTHVPRETLGATIAAGARGPVSVDLVSDGPHAIVGGTTGSGKSEVLVSWVLALAEKHSASEVNFLLVDFKGGATFAAVASLPHTVGVMTDLNEPAASRAILSLRAELLRRERALADAGVTCIAELSTDVELPRLVIVVDEFASLVSKLPDLQELFTDLAARGRSLGVHLILCTQRPAGSIRDAVLANCAIRLSLRVNNIPDSTAVVGAPDAANIPHRLPGRGLLVRGAGEPQRVQWALAEQEDVVRILARSAQRPATIRRPWLDPLPPVLEAPPPSPGTGPALVFGVADLPDRQRQEPAAWDPSREGNLLVVGGFHSGKSTVLARLVAEASAFGNPRVEYVPPSLEAAWDAVTTLLPAIRDRSGPNLVMVDDIDLLVGRFSHDHEAAFVEQLCAAMREGPGFGTTFAVTAGAVRGRVQGLAALCESTLVLRMRDRQEHVLAGGVPAQFSEGLSAGGGFWRGNRVQVYRTQPLEAQEADESSPLEFPRGSVLAVVSPHSAALRVRLEALGHVHTLDPVTSRTIDAAELFVSSGTAPTILVGDPDSWHGAPGLLAALRSRAFFAFHDCSLADFRSLARTRELPPPVTSAHSTVVVLRPDGSMARALLPA